MIHPVRFFLLGTMRAQYGDEGLPVGSPLQQAMLAALLLRDGRAAGAGELIEALWGDEAPASASAMLRTYAWRWRKVLEHDSDAPVILTSVGDGYRTVVPAGAVDALHMEKLAAAAIGAARGGEDPAQVRRLFAEALELWGGEPLTGVPGPYAQQQRTRLRELRTSLLEERCALDLELGDTALAVPVLRDLTAEHPLRERPYALLMRALYQNGCQADALALFDRARRLLAEELGVDPGPELREIHQRILRNDPALLGPAAVRPAPVVQPGPVPAHLPADTPDFTGREAELEALHSALAAAVREPSVDAALPIAAISGMGGVGKTALALRVAHRLRAGFPDGQLYADLRGDQDAPADPNVLLASFLTALGIAPGAVPEALEDRARLFRSLLDVRRVLVVLDNARDAAQVRPLLPGSARCAVLVTGRARLFGLATAVQVDLDVFSVAEARRLLARTAGAERVAADPAAVGELIRHCGRLPLAVRIVAARLASRPSWTVARLADRMAAEQDRMAELRLGDLAVAGAFEWGYRQLTAEQADAFRMVAAVCRPDIGVPAAAAVLGTGPRHAEDLLESLVDAGMLTAPRPGRYRYHDLLRVFALQLAGPDGAEQRTAGESAADEVTTALRRQLRFLLANATAAFQQLVPGDPIGTALTPVPAPGATFEDAQAAADWVAEEFEAAITAVLATAHRAAPAEDVRVAADLLVALSPFDADPRYERLTGAAAAVAQAADALGDQRSLGRAEFIRGNLAVQAARLDEAAEHSRRAADACRAGGDVVVLQQALNDLGVLAQFRHRYQEAVHHYDEANSLARALGHRAGQTATALNSALAQVRDGRPAEAAAACRRLLPGLTDAEEWTGLSYALYVLGLASHELGEHRQAVTALEECLRICRAAGIPLREAQARYRLADTLRLLDRHGEALDQALRAVADCRELAAERDRGHALVVTARTLDGLGRTEEALERLREAEELFDGLGLPDAEDVRQVLARLDGSAGSADAPEATGYVVGVA
ncbi:BTAD domain-containing putative transcriptional regulator [Streptomyces sp. SP17BM10]|uniref:AfsR/SARP family transcriptional regulator n=1 Tax=Streptomyces sp. SP17BM10 TaxID=3002530 RepID=UPI002E768D3B|nr:BTAD domain-containing putative transcriptional regulator [Streptomyces sp. SP17BM10]MEE1782619.1 BTAD domain-containing putative transcriptional regulator [Streptomyces sp. SP17BM10]